ncbi:MAG: carbohydrate binding family 9 domain-containing protein, partial [Acidobacteriota bacterium]|nr:carbohydrate binding family 9 domain-containing protein [Acidobacteriota bacterium]
TKDAVYFAVTCYDSEPEKIIATERRRDQSPEKDDSFWIVLDTYNDHRNAFLFATNPLGVRFDQRITDEGRDVDLNWDGEWEVSARRTSAGWTANIKIPFKTLRIKGDRKQVWGIDFQRLIRRKNESAYWSNYHRNYTFLNVSQAGKLVGIEDIETGYRVRLKPYVAPRVSNIDGNVSPGQGNAFNAGLDVKYRVTPSLTADFTIHPDFAQTDVDEQVVNLTRFPIFFPEKREFFREDLGLFEFGTDAGSGNRDARDLKLFFSRRIGLSSRGEPVPIIAGAKVTGKVKGFNVGFINMQTRALRFVPQAAPITSSTGRPNEPGSNFTVIRIKRDVLARSSLGAIFTNRTSGGANHNRAGGVDANFRFFQNLQLQTFVAKTETPGLKGEDWSWRGRAFYDNDFISAELAYLDVGKNFNPEIGFVPRVDQRSTTANFQVKPRPKHGPVRQFQFSSRIDYTENRRNILESRRWHYFTVRTIFQSGDRIVVDQHKIFERLPSPFSIRPDIRIPVGGYRSHDIRIEYQASSARKIAGDDFAQVTREWGFFGGDRTQLKLNPEAKFSKSFSVNFGYTLDDVHVPQGSFRAHVVNSRANYSFSNNLLTSLTVTYNSLNDLFNARFRLNYIFRKNDNFFIVYDEGRGADGHSRRALTGKFTYTFDF